MSKEHNVRPIISDDLKTVTCVWCGEKLKFDPKKGWVHQDGSIYKQTPDGKDDHCALPRRSE